jgi:hypothetical protein
MSCFSYLQASSMCTAKGSNVMVQQQIPGGPSSLQHHLPIFKGASTPTQQQQQNIQQQQQGQQQDPGRPLRAPTQHMLISGSGKFYGVFSANALQSPFLSTQPSSSRQHQQLGGQACHQLPDHVFLQQQEQQQHPQQLQTTTTEAGPQRYRH